MNHTEIEQRIEEACRHFGFDKSWRLWYHPRAWAEERRPLVLGIHPAAGGNWRSHGRYSQERGSAFLVEDWGAHSKIQGPILEYLRIARLSVTGVSLCQLGAVPRHGEKALRQHRWSDLNKWCRGLWRELLPQLKPRLILCVGAIPRDGVRELLGSPDRSGGEDVQGIKGAHCSFRIDRYERKRLSVVSVPSPSQWIDPLNDPHVTPVLERYLGAIAGVVA